MKNAKLIKGVIYDDVNLESIREEMFDQMVPIGYIKQCDVCKILQETNSLSEDDSLDYLVRSDVIDSLTRYDTNTHETHNLIIPKECLSDSLVEDLERVDLAKGLCEYYGQRHYEEHCVTPEDICEDLDGELIDAIKNGKKIVFVADKDMTVNEFKENFTNFIKELERAVVKSA